MRYSSIAIIPARGGSKAIPRKNIKPFLGLPLIQWTIDVARASNLFSRVIVTTDDRDIYELSKKLGAEVPFLRPPSLAQDDTPTAKVIRHAVDWLREVEQFIPDGVVILEPTSPGRQSEHIQSAINLLFTDDTDSLASVGQLPQNHAPQKQLNFVGQGYIMGLDGTHPKDIIMRRQEMQETYVFDGNIFACRTNVIVRDPINFWGERVKGLAVDSRYSVDLNNLEEWSPAEDKLRFLLD